MARAREERRWPDSRDTLPLLTGDPLYIYFLAEIGERSAAHVSAAVGYASIRRLRLTIRVLSSHWLPHFFVSRTAFFIFNSKNKTPALYSVRMTGSPLSPSPAGPTWQPQHSHLPFLIFFHGPGLREQRERGGQKSIDWRIGSRAQCQILTGFKGGIATHTRKCTREAGNYFLLLQKFP